MNSYYAGPVNNLDRIRRTRGINACKNIFRRFGNERRQTAVQLINDDRLLFASLFILQPEIRELNLNQELSERNRTALNICEKISSGKKPADGPGASIDLNNEAVHLVLLWMFHTGSSDDGLSNEFDQTLDLVASVLIRTHHEKVILPAIADLIFKRNRKNSYIHDLTWVFFQAREADAMRFIAERLRSPIQKDVELARTLLHLPDNIPLRTNRDKQKQYGEYISWLKENSPYLYFTGESFQLTNNPAPCSLNMEAKYLCKNISPRGSKPLTPITETELSSLNNFNSVQEEEKKVLAKYSQKLHEEDQSYWNQWLQYPVSKQVEIAKYGRREFI